jgi:hypothetical protein
MRVDHITSLLALLLPDPTHEVAIDHICKGYSLEDSSHIWAQWAPYLRLSPSHPLAEGTGAKDFILTMLQTVYTTPEMAARDIQALTDLVASAISTEIFMLFTTVTLREDEMVTHPPSRLHSRYGWLALSPLTHGALTGVPASPCYLIGRSVPDHSRPQDPQSLPSLARTFSYLAISPRPISLSLFPRALAS